ncbi:hypothetical protein B0H63DRAFT_519121 [Podospora didyma]|uniref:Uncharacterized protein n=1 Tax=Podospora didyma TaxID=330526 RepID=A0AAE0U3Q7_9PEZI|nr:hypothetical protein B0H63DRAFT_519121 [Podospora didyma]
MEFSAFGRRSYLHFSSVTFSAGVDKPTSLTPELAGDSNVAMLYPNSFLPFSIPGPVLSQVSMNTAICLLSEQTAVDRGRMIAARGHAISELHRMLGSPQSSTSDEAIAYVVRLVVNDLCYGETQHLRVHIDGVREMTRLRGGLASLGMDGTLAKMVIIADMATSIAAEMSPSYPEQEVSEYTASLHNAESPAHGSPALDSPLAPSPKPAHPSSLEPDTTALLNDIEFLVETALALPQDPSSWELKKLDTMSKWVLNRLSGETELKSPAASYLHRAVKLAGLVYCRGIQERRRLTEVAGEAEVIEIVDAVRMVPLDIWKNLLGTLLWILGAILPAARSTPRIYTSKSMVMAVSLQMALGDWGTTVTALSRAIKLQTWLCGRK